MFRLLLDIVIFFRCMFLWKDCFFSVLIWVFFMMLVFFCLFLLLLLNIVNLDIFEIIFESDNYKGGLLYFEYLFKLVEN